MALFSRHRSFTEKVLSSRKRRRAIGKAILVILAVSVVRALFFQSFAIESTAMEPNLAKGDRVLSFPLPVGAVTFFGKLPALSEVTRGELIVVAPPQTLMESRWFLAWDSLVRFFTLQRVSPLSSRYGKDFASPGIYRVIGLPGDALRREGSSYEIQPRGAKAFSSEFELSGLRYSIAPTVSRLSPGNYELGPNEYFIACDDRSVFLGSPLVGPIGSERIIGRVIAIVWPLHHLKLP